MKTKVLIFLAVILAVSLVSGCATLKNFLNGSTTTLTSGSLAEASALRAMGVTIAGTVEGDDYAITPTQISGKVMSIVLPIDGEEDEGITPFGSGRPDIAPANSTLYDFDLSEVTTLKQDVLGLKPGFKGGACNQIIMMFGYFDVEFLQNGVSKEVRFCYGDTDPLIRGDKLLLNADGMTDGKFYWYSSTEGFVASDAARPADATVNTFVRDYTDNIRTEMHYYMLGAGLRNNTDYDGSTSDSITLSRTLCEDNDLAFTVDFDVQNCVVFRECGSRVEFNALTDAQLIEKFDMKQNVSDWSNTQLYCSITLEATAKY